MEKKYQLLGPLGEGKAENLLEECADSYEEIQRLQALLSEWLRMENLVVLTAAGCSIDCGGKTMPQLEIKVLEAVNKIPELSAESLKIIEKRLDKSSEKTEQGSVGFEQWISYLVNSVYLAQESTSPVESLKWRNSSANADDVRILINYIAKAIYAECALTLPDETASEDNKKKIAPHLAFLSKLMARDSNLGRTHLFTLNYDTLFEQAIELLGIQYFDGFSGRANARFDPSVYGLDVYYPGELAEGRVRRFDKFLHFYKLHGSIHWRIQNNEVRAQHNNIDNYSNYQKYR